ncbi:hypothetical protein PRIPAC_82671, partial [Pristionchus pacificus]|uniref:G protein-coupled receptor n=1 Tax=Pristionchus pacificus TaxID=54126 RepID=A0A2A6C4I4_PRIPA
MSGSDHFKMQFGIIRCIHNVSCLASLLLNSVLFTFILKKTPFHLRSYSIVLLNFAIIEVITAISSLNTAEYTLGAITGPCRLFESGKLCFITLGCMMHGHSHYCVLLAFGFCYRYSKFTYLEIYYILMHRTPHHFSLVLSLLFVYAPTAIVYILYGSTPVLDSIALKKVIINIYPDYDFNQRAGSEILFGAEMKWTISLGILWVQCTILPAYVIIIASSILTHRLLDTNLQMSEGNKRVDYYADFQTQTFTFFEFSVSLSNFRPTKLGMWVYPITPSIDDTTSGRNRSINFFEKGLMKQALLPTLYTFSVAAHIAKVNGFFSDSEEASYVPMTIGSLILAASPTITLSSIPPYRRSYSIVPLNFAIVESVTAISSMSICIQVIQIVDISDTLMNTAEYFLEVITGPCRLTGAAKMNWKLKLAEAWVEYMLTSSLSMSQKNKKTYREINKVGSVILAVSPFITLFSIP